MVVAAAIFFDGALLMGSATNYAFLMVGRFVAGVGVGYALMVVPVYTAEVSPACSRGFLTSFPEVFINGGSTRRCKTSFKQNIGLLERISVETRRYQRSRWHTGTLQRRHCRGTEKPQKRQCMEGTDLLPDAGRPTYSNHRRRNPLFPTSKWNRRRRFVQPEDFLKKLR
ncbi:hypothetical protein K7X08_008795 [Anisodus acutangulus]|uniref:Major facilitator superfamily (MFS) profile domain-containing protein n=1 Tax=Anisodus acutangulus TaxID=402998 RepID=A0A9Q1RSW2_9SOLA|nr:hypothetical protein K7X08_008795 [Anisodus acutangulus]